MSYFSSRLVIHMRSGTPVDPPGDLPPFRFDQKLRRSKYVELTWSKLLQPRQKDKMVYMNPGGIVGCWSPHGLLCWLGGSTLVRLSVLLLRCSQQGCAGRPFIPRGGAGQGKGKNPRGGAGRRWKSAGRGGAKKRANQPIQKIYKSAKNIILHIIILIII